MSNEQNPLPCACGGFWPDDHVKDCTHQEMAKLWPKSYRSERGYRPSASEVEISESQRDRIDMFRSEY